MKITTLILFFLLVSMTTAIAQDYIVLKTGTEIKCKIEKLTPKEVEYKEFDNLDGPVIAIDKASIFMLRFANGKTKPINPTTEPPVEPKPTIKDDPKQTEKVETKLTQKNEPQPTPSVSRLPQTQNAALGNSNQRLTGFIYGGVTVAMGTYSDIDLNKEEKAGGVNGGYAFGGQLGYRLNASTSIISDLQYSGHKYELFVSDIRNVYSLTGDWSHFSSLLGVRFERPVTKKINVYSVVSLGASFAQIKGDLADAFKAVNVPSNTTSFSYGVSWGFVFADHFDVGFKYLNSFPTFSDYKPFVSTIQMNVGYRF